MALALSGMGVPPDRPPRVRHGQRDLVSSLPRPHRRDFPWQRKNVSALRYATIVVDPPWPYARANDPSYGTGVNLRRQIGQYGRKPLPYPEMTLEDIAALPVPDLAERDAHLYLWTTQLHLEAALTISRE